MADIRLLQEQSQQLQNLIGSLNAALTEALKAVNARLDEQANATRKGLADQKLIIDNLSSDLRIVREKVDDNNVRISSLSQEVDALRQAVQQQAPRVGPAPEAAFDPAGCVTRDRLYRMRARRPQSLSAPLTTRLYEPRLLRLHGGPVGLGHPGIRVLHPVLSEVRSCRRRPSFDWQLAFCRLERTTRRQKRTTRRFATYPGGDAIPEAHLQERPRAPKHQTARTGVPGLRLRGHELSRQPRGTTRQAADDTGSNL